MTVSNAFQLGLIVGLSRGELASARHLAFRGDNIPSQEGLTAPAQSFKLVPSMEIQDSKKLNKTCCLNGGTCILGSFCACPPSFYGRNCEHSVHKQHCGALPHGTWLPKKCSLCRCWHGQVHCFHQPFLQDCGARVMDDHFMTSKSPNPAPPAWTPFLLAGLCLLMQSYR
ncbi:teratocarcinoma-derived growth factor 1 [Dipodomys spectabilis]|uniref:teratocarcinoma-derived growth factor 1 n=1 Tax=Dipodomys spectabilis TaxID=105255 RepID=UPI001C53AB20|nr:teratocarcinoma-derived growth factor 1 [Dipodomys spectabilis]